MIIFPGQAEAELVASFKRQSVVNHDYAAWACLWLEACGYPGLKLAQEALRDEHRELALVPDAMGLDLQNVSCLFLAPAIGEFVRDRGRVFLRNVRHGLYLVPLSIRDNVAIGCPVDPAFAYGGERTKNPYLEKLELAARDGITVDDDLWLGLKELA
jgi:hypothetical protein